MAKDSIEKEKQDNSNTPGAGLSKSEAAIKKTKEITDQLNNITNKIQIGLTFAILGQDGLQTIKTLANQSDEEAYKAKQELKKQAKDGAWATIQENLPTRQEIIDKLMGYSCDLIIIKTVKKTKTKLEDGLNKGKEIAENVVKKLEKLQKRMDKAAKNITTIATILAVFQALIITFEILVLAASLAINFFTGIFAAAGLEKKINDSIAKAQKFILKYTEATKNFTGKCLKILSTIMIIFNLIPKILKIFTTLLDMIVGFLALINKLFKEYIEGCTNRGELVIENSDGTTTNNLELLDNFLNSNLEGNNNGTPPDIYDNYTYDQGDNRIYKPKKN
jgi:uncharacterized protein (UPF0305 family)